MPALFANRRIVDAVAVLFLPFLSGCLPAGALQAVESKIILEVFSANACSASPADVSVATEVGVTTYRSECTTGDGAGLRLEIQRFPGAMEALAAVNQVPQAHLDGRSPFFYGYPSQRYTENPDTRGRMEYEEGFIWEADRRVFIVERFSRSYLNEKGVAFPAAEQMYRSAVTNGLIPAPEDIELAVLLESMTRMENDDFRFASPGAIQKGMYGSATFYEFHETQIPPDEMWDAKIIRYGDERAARSALDAARQDEPITSFHGYPASEWQHEETDPYQGWKTRHLWQSGRWLIDVAADDWIWARSIDDLRRKSEWIYQSALSHRMIPELSATHTGTATPTWNETATPIPIEPTITNTPPFLPDLTVLSMRIDMEPPGTCWDSSSHLGLRAFIKNIGKANAGPFDVVCYGQNRTTVVQGLEAGTEIDLWCPGYAYMGTNTVVVDPDNSVIESDEGNNSLSAMVPVPTQPPACRPQ